MTTTGLPHLRLLTAAALALSLIATLLASPTLAQGRKAACATRGRSAHVHCTAHARKARPTHAGKRHKAAHGVLVNRPTAPIVPRIAAPAKATCEDGECQASSEEDAGGGQPPCEDTSACGPAEEDPASACREAPFQGPSRQGADFACEG